jgi:hypothetical protein
MNTRDLVLVGAGVVVGYLLVGYLNKSKDNAQTSTDSSGSSEPKNQILFDCEKMWQERAEMIKGTPEFLLKQKEGFLSLCKEGKIDFTKDYGNGLFVTYKNDCNKITKKCPIIRVDFDGGSWYKTNDGKYFRQGRGGANITVVPTEITEKQWIEEAISKVPF